MKKTITLILFLLLMFGLSSALATNEPTIYESTDFRYILLEDGTAEITEYLGSADSLIIPEVLDGYMVTSIGRLSFSNCLSLTSVSIPDSVTHIGESAFYYCAYLTSITIPDSVTCIEECAFDYCASLTSITIPGSVTSINDRVFYNCESLSSVTIPDSVTSIGNEAFYSCFLLTSITIPNSVTSIGDEAFSGSGLTSVTIPDSVTSIGDNPFKYCIQLSDIIVSPDHPILTTIDGALINDNEKKLICYPFAYSNSNYVIPQGIRSIGDDAFYGCLSLTSVIIPDSVTSIGDGAFSVCGLTSVAIPDSVTSIGDNAFFDCYSLTSITVSHDLYAAQYCEANDLPYNYIETND